MHPKGAAGALREVVLVRCGSDGTIALIWGCHSCCEIEAEQKHSEVNRTQKESYGEADRVVVGEVESFMQARCAKWLFEMKPAKNQE
jgi:hypothetical protein